MNFVGLFLINGLAMSQPLFYVHIVIYESRQTIRIKLINPTHGHEQDV
ncbi:hypothetical protein MUA95_02295 [Staphylococcus agnetis]|uniref:Uncharacterized protein n=1 Tax=Staphylococcus agnetis TaxID=985762 RepID=A0ABD7TXF4_9STAP|nr:hypothetical protein [Staphylococcus agnetis]UXU57662.1 hypothetical protein MUA95_02295 [Staphylococcus agnetis]